MDESEIRWRLDKAIEFANTMKVRFFKNAEQTLSDNPPSAVFENVLWENAALLAEHLMYMLGKIVVEVKDDGTERQNN